MNTRLFVCTTCDRYAPPNAGGETPGRCLAVAAKSIAARSGVPVVVRAVECLNGCPRPCTAALRDPGKSVVRFSGLTAGDAAALLEAAEAYARSADGKLNPDSVPAGLRAKMAGRVDMAA